MGRVATAAPSGLAVALGRQFTVARVGTAMAEATLSSDRSTHSATVGRLSV